MILIARKRLLWDKSVHTVSYYFNDIYRPIFLCRILVLLLTHTVIKPLFSSCKASLWHVFMRFTQSSDYNANMFSWNGRVFQPEGCCWQWLHCSAGFTAVWSSCVCEHLGRSPTPLLLIFCSCWPMLCGQHHGTSASPFILVNSLQQLWLRLYLGLIVLFLNSLAN